MYFNHKNEINLDHINNKKHLNDKNSNNEDILPPTLKHCRRDKFQEETMPFLGEYDPPVPYPVSTNMLHNNGSNSSGIGSYTGQGMHFGNAAMRSTNHREGRIVTTDVEDLSTDDDNTCPANNKRGHDEMFDSMSSNPASSIMNQEMNHPSALLNSIPPPPSEPPPSTPRDSYQESVFPKCSMMIPVSHNGMQGIRGLMDQDHILQQKIQSKTDNPSIYTRRIKHQSVVSTFEPLYIHTLNTDSNETLLFRPSRFSWKSEDSIKCPKSHYLFQNRHKKSKIQKKNK